MRTILSLLLVIAIAPSAFAQTSLLSSQEKLIREAVAAKHIEPRPVDDKFAAQFFTTYINVLDGSHLFLPRLI